MATYWSKIAEKKPTPLLFDVLCPAIPTNIRLNLILLETAIFGLHFCRWQYGSIFILIFAVGSERHKTYV